MSFYNGILNHDDNHESSQGGQRGLPGVGFKLDSNGNYDLENKKLTNVKNGDADHDVMVKSQIEGYVSNNFVAKSGDTMLGPLVVQKDDYPFQGNLNKVISYEAQREIFLSKKEGGKMEQAIDMNGFTIENLKSPTASDHATSKVYVDNKVNSKADTSDLDNYLKIDGTKAMTGNINMNNNRILSLPNPQLDDEPVTRKFLTQTNTLFYNIFLDLDGNAQMRGNIKMNDKRITGLTNPPNADDEATNKQYVDDNISKANIKPSQTPKNAFKYLMSDINEWSSEYNVKVVNFLDLAESPHSWDKRVLKITAVKDGSNYRFRLGLQMYPLVTNESYSLVIELYNRDFQTWKRQQTYIEATGIWLKSYNTKQFQHQYGSSGDLYYTKTLIKFKKTSSSAPVFVYYTVHYDNDGGDMNTYPSEFKNQLYIVAYGIVGETDHVDSEVYDAHQAYEINKTEMKMLVPLDMNNKKIINISDDSHLTKINLYGMVDKRRFFTAFTMPIEFNKVRIINIKLLNTVKTRLKKDVINFYITSSSIIKFPFTFPGHPAYIYIQINKFFNVIHYIKLVNTVYIPFQITYDVFY